MASNEYDALISWVDQKLHLFELKVEWSDTNNKSAVEFLTGFGPKTLSVVRTQDDQGALGPIELLCEASGKPSGADRMVAYIIRADPDEITLENVAECLQCGTIGRGGLNLASFERVMKGLVEKQVSQNTALTDGACNDLSSHYHRCMATLTDTIHFADRKTVLYCPEFPFTNVAEAALDKDLVQIIESVVIHWTRQIKDVVNNQDMGGSAEVSGPLEEIDFWKGRTQDLVGIQEQVQSGKVGRILEVLRHAKSNYIGPFEHLTQQILTRAAEANDNLKFLESIRPQCVLLREVEAQKVITVLPDLLTRVRLIWSLSKFYNSEDHIAGLLRKITNDIIRRFHDYVPVNDVFDGDVEFVTARLNESIHCGTEWKRIYHAAAASIARQKDRYGRCWEMDDAAIFAQLDAFVQRCRDLIEVCESQMQFARKSSETGGEPGRLPEFAGTKAQEIVDGMIGIQQSFEEQIDRLRKLDYDILDVRLSLWHDDYHHFKRALKDLEVMYTNVINSTFENATTMSDGAGLVETFHRLAKRDTIHRCVEKKAGELQAFFLKGLTKAYNEFEEHRANPPLRPAEPQYSGSGLWAHSLALLVKENFEALCRIKHVLNERLFEEAKTTYVSLAQAVRDFKGHRYQMWIEILTEQAKDDGLMQRLNKTLLRRTETEPGVRGSVEILCNFDEGLLLLFSEVSYWEKFHGEFSIPYMAHDICTKRDLLRVMRDNVMLVVRAYNDIIRDIGPEEKRLFVDHMRRLDRKMSQGINKLTWQSKNMIEMYVRDCLGQCLEVHSIIKAFKNTKRTIGRLCKNITTAHLIKIDKNTIYDEGVFESRQLEHRAAMHKQFKSSFDEVMAALRTIFLHFKEGSSEVQREWKSQVTGIDKLMEQSLKSSVKKSLQELSRAINGDSKTDPQTLFTVRIILEANKEGTRVTYKPSMVNLTHSVNLAAKEIISMVSAVPRLRVQSFEQSAASSPPLDADDKYRPYYDIISEDSDILRLVVAAMNGMSSSATELQKYLSYWDKYKALWEMDKDFFIRKYAKQNRNPSQFDADISRYKHQQGEIQGESSNHSINFIRVDCNTLKDGLVGHCLSCQNLLTGLLNQNGANELKDIYRLFSESDVSLRKAPTDLDELAEKIALCKGLKDDKQTITDRFDPVREVYDTLTKFEVVVKEEELGDLGNLETAFDDFTSMLFDCDRMLEKAKVGMKRDLESQVDAHNEGMSELKSTAAKELPFSSDNKMADVALAAIADYKQRVAKAREHEVSLAKGLSIFAVVPSENEALTKVADDLDLLTQIWEVNVEWAGLWRGWSESRFSDLDTDAMEVVAGGYTKRVGKLGRTIKRWGVWEKQKKQLDQFRDIIPLIQDLRNPALRPRHWESLCERIGEQFDPTSESFSLDEVVRLGLTSHTDFIGDMSSNANKELAIEVSLKDLVSRWQDIEVDVGPYKDKYYKLRSTDDISQSLEDDAVALSTMKASKFYGSFKGQIDHWEHLLSTISEVVENLLAVQRKWIYLESIFMSGGDISKQLPEEYVLFVRINNDFSTTMNKFHITPKAKDTCADPEVLATINAMDEGLERIQKSLDQYLETKRMVFPRFYFVSDDDLLEILGQSRDPMAVQRHIKKCYEGVHTLKLVPPGPTNKTYEATSMVAPDTEVAPFADNVVIDGAVELWLVEVTKAMVRGMNKLLMDSIKSFRGKKEKWINDVAGQLLITTGSIVWTIDCVKALNSIQGGSKGAMKQTKKKQVSYLNKLTGIIRGQLTKVVRNKVVALITMEIHNRDVMEKMVKVNCSAVSDFEWMSQLRFIYTKDGGEFGKCEVRQTNSVLEWSGEYQGNNGRLVVTPLTDRCVLTLITAMYLNRGGNPLGPAGTGKTETVKDLSKNLAKYVVVINCSDGMDYRSVGRIFSGLVQSGSWGCFDEFNRIKIEVISVVAMQIQTILNALTAKVSSFQFMGAEIPCNHNCGVFITMNPGYAGRTELPDNLKALMRPVAMMAPDLTMIAEVMLASEGFNEARILAKKTVTLYSLMVQQLSKQDHYDYGLRNLKAVLNMAGQIKRADANMPEESILMRALRDMNLPKFIKDDERLFRLLLGDLFPGLELPVSEFGVLGAAINDELDKAKLQRHPFLLDKIFQFYDSRMTRHCNMLVGDPMGGKSTIWKMLTAAQTTLNAAGNADFEAVTVHVLSPKSVELDELYGAYDLATFEWNDGILSTIFKQCSESDSSKEKWLLFDGPIDAMWIESMNSVMDDNRILTLINGDRIPLTGPMSLVFETQDLRVASPATVSRAGMIYIDAVELDASAFTESWILRKFTGDGMEGEADLHRNLINKWIPTASKFKDVQCKEPVGVDEFGGVVSLTILYDALRKKEGLAVSREKLGETYDQVVEKLFLFALVWSIGATVDDMSRRKFNTCLSDIDSIFPPTNTIYDYNVDITKNEFVPWENKVPTMRATPTASFFDLIVPTVDTVRNGFICNMLMNAKRNVMITGGTGSGKTILANSMLTGLPDTHHQLVVNFSAATTSGAVQEIIEGPMEKRSKDKLGPQGGKNLVIFIDDFNMPKKTSFESPFQPPLELIRLYMDYGGWYDRIKCSWKYILDSQLIVALGHPGGGRNTICARTQSRFSILNCTTPADSQVVKIFESILTHRFVDYDTELKAMAPSLAIATLQVYKTISADFLSTPEKFHYLFNLRDVAKVMQGILMAGPATIDTPDAMCRLWVHECQRVFADRFVRSKTNDEQRFFDILLDKMNAHLGKEMGAVLADCIAPHTGPMFVGFMVDKDDDAGITYEEMTDYGKVRQVVEEKLEDYNMEPKLISMDLAMFRDAIMHVSRIHRVLCQPRGNIMLVGVGGSGRSSLTRLACYIAGMSTFTIEITKNYRLIEFREDLKRLYTIAGCDAKDVVFLFNDTQIKDEGFLEDINNILSSGVVPNLFLKDEVPAILDAVRKPALNAGLAETPDVLWAFFINQVRAKLHVVLACSFIGESLRNRCRMYPGLVNCTTIDWFHTWPSEALQEVALKFLAEISFSDDDMRPRIAIVFADMHLKVIQSSDKLLAESKRYNYVTPTNYLELVKGYRILLAEKTKSLGSAAEKLANGLAKLEDAQEQVGILSKELEVKKVVVAQSQKDCEDLLVEIVSERRVADEQRKTVEADSARIGVEAAECKAISDDAEADLAVAMPALEKAMKEVEKLDKSSVSEVKAYAKPPALVETVLSAVMILFGRATDWATAKKTIGESNFLQQIKSYDKDNVPQAQVNKIKKYVDNKEFDPESVRKVSSAAAALCIWVHAIYIYANVAKEVDPKRRRLKEATMILAEKQAGLKAAQEALALVTAKIKELQDKYDTSVGEKNRLKEESENLEAKLDRADKLVNGLAGEYVRWQGSIGEYNASLFKVTGDALVAAAFMSYAGPFETRYRVDMCASWSASVQNQRLPFTEGFNFVSFLANPEDVRDWNIQGLPKDDFSTENGVISTRGNRWPLMIDPQGQANRWIRNMEGDELKIIDLKTPGFLRDVENAVQFGFPILLQDILEEIDPALEPVLSKSLLKIGNRVVMRIGDKELDYSPDFRMYITTKLANPHYTPEISTKATVVNFAVKKDGLEAQLLGIVVQKEEPMLEQQKSALTIKVAAGKRQLVALEDEILRLLSESKGSLLDDVELVDTLGKSKVTSEEVTQQLVIAEETEKKIDIARLGYRTAAIRASLAYFVLDDMGRVDPMYQFSLDAYVDLFNLSIDNSRVAGIEVPVAHRCEDINKVHTLAVYQYTCRGLFEAHKLLFSLQLCFKILETTTPVPADEFNFFTFGPGMVDREMQKAAPADWISPLMWDSITEMDKLAGFTGLMASIEQTNREWKAWYMSGKPEEEELPGEWASKCTEMQKLCIIRALRIDRLLFSAVMFIATNIGPEYVDPPPFDLEAVFQTSNCKTPLIFVLSPGVDPTAGIYQLAGQINQEVENCALGQGQAPVAVRMIDDGIKTGGWVFLANCHLMLSWMPTLEKMIEKFVEGNPHKNFRLWLSSSPHPQFPIAILQRGIKMTTEPPKGLRANLLTLFNTVSEEQFGRCGQVSTYKRLLFGLVWFHAILLERRKFKSLGFNIPYDFNGSDFAICHDLIIVFLDEYPDRVPYDAMKYLIAEANYGGRVTDDWDRRLVNVYISELMHEDVVHTDNFLLSELPQYYVPDDGTLKSYKDTVRSFPPTDHPMAFGQHPNADISSQIDDSNIVIDVLLGLQPAVIVADDENAEDPVAAQGRDLLEQCPPQFNLREVRHIMASRSDPDPLKTVLFQELDRYNDLLGTVRRTLFSIVQACAGLALVTPELEEVMDALRKFKVARPWSKAYPSAKPLGSWMIDLVRRCEQFATWSETDLPKHFWLPGFTYPSGFLTAILQTCARTNGVAIDALSWEFPVLQHHDTAQVTAYPKEGVYVTGLYVEGACWNFGSGFLEEPRPMELVSTMPIVHFKPVEGKRKSTKGYYSCPVYLYPVRTGSRERPSYVVTTDLRSGKFSQDFWTKRGVALLLSTSE